MSITPAQQKLRDDLYAVVGTPVGPKDLALANKVKALADQVLALVLPVPPPPPPPPPWDGVTKRRTGLERRACWSR